MISVPRSLVISLVSIFSAYHLVLALVSISVPVSRGPYIAAMVIYAVATVASLVGTREPRMPVWLASFNVAASVAMSLLVNSQLPGGAAGTYAGWHTAAIGTLMVITSTRRRQTFAWIGVAALAVQTVAWEGLDGLIVYGVIGSIGWVAISHALAYSLASASRDARQYALAEREAAAWRAAQEAHIFERQFRLGQTSRIALPILSRIVATGGRLTEAERQECLYLEGAIRDEIRGRGLLNNRVRDEVMAARRRGTTVTLLDEGGIDDMSEVDVERVLNLLASAISSSGAQKLVVRTVPHDSETAVTVVGLNSARGDVDAQLGPDHDDDDNGDEIDLWLEIPRRARADSPV
ncbi:hypothetical protein [Marisediminicola senii]|uniref:hypothetical protein n=1 Tax=Marisediminicola senii TaxID=2711233 RepID=UPI0013ECA6C5|nr:hypothetical protein [Marisediminicola senii]